MRGLISLAVIFFVALSAQASASFDGRTLIECKDREVRGLSSGKVKNVNSSKYFISYAISKRKKSIDKIIDLVMVSKCLSTFKLKSDFFSINFSCIPQPLPLGNHPVALDQDLDRIYVVRWSIDRITGEYVSHYKSHETLAGFDDKEVEVHGSCNRVKQKF
mgnify:CR=1 FL=1